MKFPKNRADLYLVVRDDFRVACGAFSDLEEAQNFADACRQDWEDRFPYEKDLPNFNVELTTFYG